MKTLLIALFLVLQLRISAEGCSWPSLNTNIGLYGGTKYYGSIGTAYLPFLSPYELHIKGNFACNYKITEIRIYLNGSLIFSLDTIAIGYTKKMNAYPGHYRVYFNWMGYAGHVPIDLTYDIVDNPVGIGELNEKQSIIISPNPAQSHVNIQSEKEISSVNLFNSLGALISTQTCFTQSIELPLGDYPPGIYFLHVAILGEQTTIKKIVIQ